MMWQIIQLYTHISQLRDMGVKHFIALKQNLL